MPDYFIMRQGKQQGPFSSDKLKSLAAAGQLSPSDMLWCEGMANWVPASEQEGLFNAKEHEASTPGSASARKEGDEEQREPRPRSERTAGLTSGLMRNPWFWTAAGIIGLLLITNLICLILLMSGGGSSARSGAVPAEVAPGVRIRMWASNGDRLVGRRDVVEVRGNWVRVRIDEGGDPWHAWVNFETVVQYEIVATAPLP